LRSQFAADEIWGANDVDELHPRTLLFAQVALGTLVTDLLRSCGIEPDAAIGYSLGESASLFACRAWTHRDQMLGRVERSPLFTSDLAHPFNAAREQWGWDTSRPIDWVTRVLGVPASVADRAIRFGEKAYVLIINTADECVVGGHRPDVDALAARLGVQFREVTGVTLAHCEVASPVRAAYRQLHLLPTEAPTGIRFYSGAWGQDYPPSTEVAADAILGSVLQTIDFPRVVEAAYRDGIRTFVEIGPGASCSRMIDIILKDRPHFAQAATVRHRDAVETFLTLLAELYVRGANVNLDAIYPARDTAEVATLKRKVHVKAHPPTPQLGLLRASPPVSRQIVQDTRGGFVGATQSLAAAAEAHEAFLRFTAGTCEAMSRIIATQTRLLQRASHDAEGCGGAPLLVSSRTEIAERETRLDVPRSLNFAQCQEFAAGSAAKVLGPPFAEVDMFPTRVRLPDGPLMLVDRIVRIEGEPRSLTSGRVITEHRVHERRWYLDTGRIPTCVAVEAGQADLFLSGFLGIDFVTRGLAVYRLLDAAITFHRPLPAVNATIRYDIHIDRFFRQGETHLFRFRFDATVEGQPLLTMTDGCAGFFTADELASGKGVVQTELDRRSQLGIRPPDWQPPVPLDSESLCEDQVDALRAGDPARAFGNAFALPRLRSPMRLPGGMLRLVDRVTTIDPDGGRFGLGRIKAEADIHPDDWFLTCHFVDDMVMPGTLMYECCLHTLRILLMRMGWIGEEGEVVCEPIAGVTSRLKCRGQVTSATKVAAYEVVLKEIGFGPEPFAIADALMYADGKPIVEMTNMSLRMADLDRAKLDEIWSTAKRAPLFDRERILAFAVGKPSEAFGERYKIFDSERVIARLPGPPYQFLDRITRIDAEAWAMKAGGIVDAEYDVPANAWYFAAHRAQTMPFSVLLEVALQPCGWLAAYVGSALTSPIDLSFRNLGGRATQHLPVGPEIGTLTTTVKLTRVSSSGGMIIQHYDFAVRSRGRDVYTGNTYFGFFSKESLANQVGLRECSLVQPPSAEMASVWRGEYPRESPFPDSMLRMVDRINWLDERGGPHGLGTIEGRIGVDPTAWFFRAHFFLDPVWPGSLGLESFVQLLRLLAHRRWKALSSGIVTPAFGTEHSWVYRGQVLPTDGEVTVQATLTDVDETRRSLTADGLLSVDGRVIYQMKQFVLQG
jgi:3-hydroxymyristoyl/3-hydroxydecanoyl-(acyl carrier protein) dehydratase